MFSVIEPVLRNSPHHHKPRQFSLPKRKLQPFLIALPMEWDNFTQFQKGIILECELHRVEKSSSFMNVLYSITGARVVKDI